MRTIIDYKVVYATTEPNISEVVAHCIKEGWQPLGPCVDIPASQHFQSYSVQTLVKYEQPIVFRLLRWLKDLAR